MAATVSTLLLPLLLMLPPPCFGPAIVSLETHCRKGAWPPDLPPLPQACCGSAQAARACW